MSYVGPPSRDEQILKAILGEGIVDFEPQSRIEALLYRIYEEGGVGGGGAKLKGYYDTVAELEAAHPTGEAGDAYLVGNPSHIYTWLVDDQEWHDGGAFTAVPGPEGVGIASIEKTSTVGLVDTYTVTYTDGDTDTFTVTNGAEGVGITDISKTGTVGNVDTYTITLSNGDTYTFNVTNGEGVGVPEGGTTGQVLVKKSNTDYDTEWANAGAGEGVPAGGTTGQILAKKSGSDYDTEWVDNEGGSDVTSEIESLSAATSELASETTVITSEVTSLTSENSTQASEIDSLSSEYASQSSEIGSLSDSMSELASTVASTSEVQNTIDSTQTSELGSLSTENSSQTSEISSLSTASSELASEIAVIGSEVADKQDQLTAGPGIDITNDVISIDTEIYADTPLGAILPFGGTTAPTGFLICDGSAVSRLTYAELFAVIGTKFGSGDGSTTFNLPNKDFGADLYPNVESKYIIKAVQTAVPVDFQTALDAIDAQLTANNQTAGVSDVPFRFGCDDNGNYGYILTEGGADTVIPFKSGGVPLSSIAVTTMPTKTSYSQNENLDLTGIVITATFEDVVTADITNACTFDPADGTQLTTLGTITVDVDYYGISTSFNVTCTSWDSNTMANNSWAAIQEHIAAGTLPASFVGQTKPITMGGNTYNLQLARINDGTGTAGTYYPNHTADFISVELMPDTHNMNSTNTNVGGWKQCAMRTYLTDTVYPALPDDLKAVIIDKTHMYTQGNQSTSFESVSDKLWLPTEWECFGSATYGGESATYNVHYSAIFPDAASRQKTRIGQTSANAWWESSPRVSGATPFCTVSNNGNATYANASATYGVVLGLRIG